MTNSGASQLVEEGAVAQLDGARAPARVAARREYCDVVVIGGGQAGLSVGYHLAREGVRFVILDANARVGDAWRNRWDSLRLFSPAKYDGLDGMQFPAPGNYFPTKDEMADYLEHYARSFRLPVRNGARVERLFKRGERYVVNASSNLEFEAAQVVVAMGKYQRPHVPEFATALRSDIVQLHAIDYRNLGQLRPGPVLLVGAGNSGADIALETVRGGHQTWLAGRAPGEIPFRPDGFLGRHVLGPLVLGFVFHYVLTVASHLGRRARASAAGKGAPLIRVKVRDLVAAGVRRVPRVVGAHEGRPLLEDGRVIDVANVIWCSGFHAGFEWIELPVFDGDGEPQHTSGVVERAPGLYFVGLPFLHAMSSAMIHGVGRDARRVAREIASRIDRDYGKVQQALQVAGD